MCPPDSSPSPSSYNYQATFSRSLGYKPIRFQQNNENQHDTNYIKDAQYPMRNPNITPVIESVKNSSLFAHAPLGEAAPLLAQAEGGDSLDQLLPVGSIRASIFNLCSATLGCGALALPFAFQGCGLLLATALLLVGAFVSIYSIRLLIECRDATLLNSYEDIAIEYFGKPMTLFVEWNIILFCFGTCVAYIVAVGDIIYPVAVALLGQQTAPTHTALIIAFVLCIMFPLSFVSKINSLRYSSMAGVLAIVFLVAAVALRAAQRIANGYDWGAVVWFNWDVRSIFTSIPIMLFAFTCQVNVFSIYTELHRPSIRRMSRVVHRGFIVNTIIYLVIGIFGALHYGRSTLPDILQNLSLSDPLMAFAQLGVGLTVVLAFPLNIYPARFTIEMMFFGRQSPSLFRFVGLTCLLVFGSLALAVYTPSINSVFALLGSTTSAVVCFILPAMYYLRVFPASAKSVDARSSFLSERAKARFLLVFGVALGVVCTAVAIEGMINDAQ